MTQIGLGVQKVCFCIFFRFLLSVRGKKEAKKNSKNFITFSCLEWLNSQKKKNIFFRKFLSVVTWAIFGHFRPNTNFLEKSDSATFYPLYPPNFMQNKPTRMDRQLRKMMNEDWWMNDEWKMMNPIRPLCITWARESIGQRSAWERWPLTDGSPSLSLKFKLGIVWTELNCFRNFRHNLLTIP